MYTRCERCGTVIPIMAVRCTICGRSRMKELFDSSNVSSWKKFTESEQLSKKIQIENEFKRRLELYQNQMYCTGTVVIKEKYR